MKTNIIWLLLCTCITLSAQIKENASSDETKAIEQAPFM
jgi:hypothetical protein